MNSNKSSDYQYTKQYHEVVEFDDFKELLLEAITTGVCLMCGSIRTINKCGLCWECTDHYIDEGGLNKEAVYKVREKYKVVMTVKEVNEINKGVQEEL